MSRFNCTCGHSRSQHHARGGARPECDYAGYSCQCPGYRAIRTKHHTVPVPPKAARIFLCANGMVCVFGADDEQIPLAQGRWLRNVIVGHVQKLGVECPENVRIAMQGCEEVTS